MFKGLLGNADRLVVVDVETTGLYPRDRVLEVAAVTVDRAGEVIDEWDTLVDPQRDVGPAPLHGVTPSMVTAAPRFEDIAGVLARRLDGAVLVAHNLTFDARMLSGEFQRVGGDFSPGVGVCTLRLGGGKLADLCHQHGIDHHHEHRALADARATAHLLARVVRDGLDTRPALAGCRHAPKTARTLRRDHVQADVPPMPYLARLASRLHHFTENAATLAYLDLLDWVLADLVIDHDEAAELQRLATDLGLDSGDLQAAHRRYFDELLAAALRDGVVTDQEHHVLSRAAVALGIDPALVDSQVKGLAPNAESVRLLPGLRVCFTGAAVYPDGTELPRSRLDAIARGFGLEPVSTVTKKACDLLVAADPASQSGKAGKARRFGIPVAAVTDFLNAGDGVALRVLRSVG